MEKNVRTKGKEMKDYTVGIWDLTFCLFDKDGNPLKDKDINNIDNNNLISISGYDNLIKFRQFY